MAEFGLIGFPLGHSFSRRFFEEKFAREGLPEHSYSLFELPDIRDLPSLIGQKPGLRGLNVTIPHKQSIIPYLDKLDPVAEKIGAVNTVKIANALLTGYNTDWLGFRDSLMNFLPPGFSGNALILGNGGSAQAVKAALNNLGITWKVVSRDPKQGDFTYANCSEKVIFQHSLIVNTTPLGMYPNLSAFPPIPYHALTPAHYLFDLIYNPEKTVFLKKGEDQGARIKSGLEMLHLQAEAAWQIWQQ